MGNPRYVKVAEQIKVIVAELLERRIKDPRLGFVTITDVRLTGDGREGTVFYTVLGDEQARDDTAAALMALERERWSFASSSLRCCSLRTKAPKSLRSARTSEVRPLSPRTHHTPCSRRTRRSSSSSTSAATSLGPDVPGDERDDGGDGCGELG